MTNKEALKILGDISIDYGDASADQMDLMDEAMERAIKALEGKRDEARWIDHDWEDMQKQGYRRCSRCRHAFKRFDVGIRKSDLPWIDGSSYQLQNYDSYCPHCGAYMTNSKIELKAKIKKGGRDHEGSC